MQLTKIRACSAVAGLHLVTTAHRCHRQCLWVQSCMYNRPITPLIHDGPPRMCPRQDTTIQQECLHHFPLHGCRAEPWCAQDIMGAHQCTPWRHTTAQPFHSSSRGISHAHPPQNHAPLSLHASTDAPPPPCSAHPARSLKQGHPASHHGTSLPHKLPITSRRTYQECCTGNPLLMVQMFQLTLVPD